MKEQPSLSEFLKSHEAEELKFFIEQGNFVEYCGHLYYVGDDISVLEEQGFQFEPAHLEKTASLATRRNVGCAPIAPNPYRTGFNVDELNSIQTDQLRILDPEGFLPDSDKIVVKRVVDPSPDYDNSKPDHVIFSKEKDAYYCIKNGCTECNVIPEIISGRMQVVSADISAQEPMCSLVVTREPRWHEVFELKNFRYDDSLLQYMDMIAEEYLRIPKRDTEYVLFIHNTYYFERSDIYKLNYLVNISKVDQTKITELEGHIKYIIDKFQKYREHLASASKTS